MLPSRCVGGANALQRQQDNVIMAHDVAAIAGQRLEIILAFLIVDRITSRRTMVLHGRPSQTVLVLRHGGRGDGDRGVFRFGRVFTAELV